MFTKRKRKITVRYKSPAEAWRDAINMPNVSDETAWQSFVATKPQDAPVSVFDVAGDQPDIEDMIAWAINRS
jgi:hypothetical protein